MFRLTLPRTAGELLRTSPLPLIPVTAAPADAEPGIRDAAVTTGTALPPPTGEIPLTRTGDDDEAADDAGPAGPGVTGRARCRGAGRRGEGAPARWQRWRVADIRRQRRGELAARFVRPSPPPRGLLGLVALLLAGCATVPGSSDVTVLRRVGDPAEPSAPPGPARGAQPLEIVRGWILASGATAERHSAAREFLSPPAAGSWDDGASPTVVSDRLDTVFSPGSGQSGTASVRVRADKLGTLRPDGAFVADPGTVDVVVGLTENNGVWRISSLPAGTIVRHADLRANTRPVRIWFLAPFGGAPVGETRYLATSPVRSVPARVLDELFSGPSDDLRGAALSALPTGVLLRSAVGTTSDGVTTVDLTHMGPVGALDETRRAEIAQQVVLTLAGVGIDRVQLSVDGAPLLDGRPVLGVADVLAGLPPAVRDRPDLPSDRAAGDAAVLSPAVVVTGGRVRAVPQDAATDPGRPAAPDLVTGVTDARSASLVARRARRRRRRARGDDDAPVRGPGRRRRVADHDHRDDRRPAVLDPGRGGGLDGRRRPAGAGGPQRVAGGLPGAHPGPGRPHPARGPRAITALRLSPDGTTIAMVAGGRVALATVVRDAGGGARLAAPRPARRSPRGSRSWGSWT